MVGSDGGYGRGTGCSTAEVLEVRARLDICSTEFSIFGPATSRSKQGRPRSACRKLGARMVGVSIPLLVAYIVGRDIYFDYDVNAGALAEGKFGAGADRRSFV
jgi:hypothetical protein